MHYLGIDFGLRRIGLATSAGDLAAPYKIIEVKNFKDALEKIMAIIKTDKIDKIVVGLPEGKLGKIVMGFITALKKTGLDVESADETLSTQNAIQQMIDLGLPRDKRSLADAYSAAIILQQYLETRTKT